MSYHLRSQMSSVLLIRLSWVVPGHEANRTGSHVQGIHVMLGEETNTQLGLLVDETLGGLKLASQQFQHCRLTSTVWPNNSNTRIELDIELDITQEQLIRGISKGDFGHLHNGWREFLDFRELEVHGILALWCIQDRHLFKFLDSRLCFRRLGSIVPELVDEG